MGNLPYIDEHMTVVDATVEDAWAALLAVLDGALSGRVAATYARAVRCRPWRPSGSRPLDVGSTVPGFSVTSAVHATELVLAGRHLFSTYELIFRLRPAGNGRTEIRAESRAVFPRTRGRPYRLCILGTGLHVRAVRRLLDSIRHRASFGPRVPSRRGRSG